MRSPDSSPAAVCSVAKVAPLLLGQAHAQLLCAVWQVWVRGVSSLGVRAQPVASSFVERIRARAPGLFFGFQEASECSEAQASEDVYWCLLRVRRSAGGVRSRVRLL